MLYRERRRSSTSLFRIFPYRRKITWRGNYRIAHDNARKTGRSTTVRQKLICRARERHDATRRDTTRRLLIWSRVFARAIGFLRGRFRGPCGEPIDRIRYTGYMRECDYARDETTGRHDPGHHSIESYIRQAFTRRNGRLIN